MKSPNVHPSVLNIPVALAILAAVLKGRNLLMIWHDHPVGLCTDGVSLGCFHMSSVCFAVQWNSRIIAWFHFAKANVDSVALNRIFLYECNSSIEIDIWLFLLSVFVCVCIFLTSYFWFFSFLCRELCESEDATTLSSSCLSSPTENGKLTTQTRSRPNSKSTLEENAYEDIVGKHPSSWALILF